MAFPGLHKAKAGHTLDRLTVCHSLNGKFRAATQHYTGKSQAGPSGCELTVLSQQYHPFLYFKVTCKLLRFGILNVYYFTIMKCKWPTFKVKSGFTLFYL